MDRQSTNLQDAVVLVTSANAEDTDFGTGFVIYQDAQASYVLTCAHILDDLEAEALQVARMPATVEARGTADGVDLAVLRVEGLLARSPLQLSSTGTQSQHIIILGFQSYSAGGYLLRPLKGELGSVVGLETRQGNVRVKAWDLKIADEYFLQPGYSGSPVIDEASQQVVGIVSTRQGEGRKGVAIAAEMLAHIWHSMPPSLHISSAIMAPESSSTNSGVKPVSTIPDYPTTEQKVVEPSTIREVDMSNKTGKAVIFTALELEYAAIRAHLSNIQDKLHPSGSRYELGTFRTPGQVWEVGIVETGPRNSDAASAVERAIGYFQPTIAFFVGIAGGLKDVELGDVVCATEVYGYESGKDTAKSFQPRPKIGISTFNLIELAKAERRKDDWSQGLETSMDGRKPKVYIAPIAAGEKVVTSDSSRIFKFLQEFYGDAVAAEMEGYGFLRAMYANNSVQALVIRGISDLIYYPNFNKDAERDKKWQPIAASNASTFTFKLLAKLATENGEIQQEPTTEQNKVATGSGGNPTVPSSDSNKPIGIFYSYVSKDQSFVDDLDTHLAVLKRHKEIITSYGALAGADRTKQFENAKIILFLISPNFLNTDSETYENEVNRAMQRQQNGEVIVIPVLLRPTDGWRLETFGSLQEIPRDKPVSKYSDRDDAFSKISREIRTIVNKIRNTDDIS